MSFTERLENVTVIGAAGKMGSGIVLLTAMEMAGLKMDPRNASMEFALNAVDVSQNALSGLMSYLRGQVRRMGEKKTGLLRSIYADRKDLIENEDVISQYIEDVMSVIRPGTNLEVARKSSLIFEAVNENLGLKLKLIDTIESGNSKKPWYLTNTSSIPISELNKKAGLGGRVIGFHFYNPPAVQKLVEVITAEETLPELSVFAAEYAKTMRKKVVPSNDIAGFIGNGHFMRDMLHGIAEVEKLTATMSFPEAVYTINKVSQEYLVRPMGIFQLVDYVGLDVCQCILSVMDARISKESLESSLIDEFVKMGVKGGQFSSGAQKDGFLKYAGGRPSAVFDPEAMEYVPVESLAAKCDAVLGQLESRPPAWKMLLMTPDRNALLEPFYASLMKSETMGAELAIRYGKRSREIGLNLVSDGAAANENDVNTVLLTGFYHVYGPINPYFGE